MLDPHAFAPRVLDGTPPSLPQPPPADPLGPALLHEAATLLVSFAIAGLTLWRKRLPGALRRAVAPLWTSFAGGLPALHTGEVGDRVAWLVFGVAALCGALALLY